jgi:Rrf2 family iron-sulfur cluster assembly transcriptional regulator
MRLTARGSYAVRAMVDLAHHGDARPVSLREIAARGNISVSYLEQLFLKLRRSRIVRSVRGPGGGYLLARNPGEISVAEIIEAVEEKLEPIYCVDPAADRKCSRADCCSAHLVWKQLATRIREYLDSVKLEELARMTRQSATPLTVAPTLECGEVGAQAAAAGGTSKEKT